MQDPEKPHKAENRLDQQTDHRFFHRHDHKKSGDVNQNTAVVVGQPGHQITSESAPKTKNGGYGYYVVSIRSLDHLCKLMLRSG